MTIGSGFFYQMEGKKLVLAKKRHWITLYLIGIVICSAWFIFFATRTNFDAGLTFVLLIGGFWILSLLIGRLRFKKAGQLSILENELEFIDQKESKKLSIEEIVIYPSQSNLTISSLNRIGSYLKYTSAQMSKDLEYRRFDHIKIGDQEYVIKLRNRRDLETLTELIKNPRVSVERKSFEDWM